MSTRIESQAEPIPGYRLIERLGGGGFGEVWKAEAPGGLHKAIKFVYGDLSDANDNGQRAEQELKALNRVKTVRHPYILSLERIEIIDGQLMIVMELADRSLWDRFRECRSQGMPGIPREELLRYMEETAEALDLMNGEHGLQHLDIKPQNLFVVHQHVKVADFGLVKDLEGMQASVTGGVTPVYAAPEIFDGKVSRYSDQYSLGIVYQELLTGQRPFNGTNIRQLILQHMQAPPDLSSLPPGDQAAVNRALHKIAAERFPKCEEFVGHLRRSNGAPVVVVPSRQLEASRTTEPAEAPSPVWPVPTTDDSGTSPEMLTQMIRGRFDTGGLRTQLPSTPRLVPFPVEPAVSATAPSEVHGDGCLFPALVVGIGQVGMLVLRRLRAELHDQFGPPSRLPNVRLLLLDTDPAAFHLATRDRYESALASSEILVAPLNRPSHYLKPRDGKVGIDSWLDPRMLYRIPRSQVPSGVRALGRLAYYDNYRTIARRLRQELGIVLDAPTLKQTARDTGLGVRSNRPRVYVIADLAGGTGGGMFLDLAYTLRALLKEMGYAQPDVVAHLFVPPLEGHGSRGMQLGNTYAALTELAYYGTPGARFDAVYTEQDGPLTDAEPPFSRTAVTTLPIEADERASETTLGRTARLLFHDLCSPLGRAIDLTRAGLSGPRWDLRGLCYQKVGIREIAWPRRHLLRTVARRLCLRLVESWMSKNGEPVRHAAQAWIDEQLTARELGTDQFIRRINDECAQALHATPEETFGKITKPLTIRLDTSDKSSSGRGSWRLSMRTPEPPELPTEAFDAVLKCLAELLGQPGDEAGEATTPVAVGLRDAADRLSAEWGQKYSELHVRLIEQPGLRLVGAEEAIGHVIAAIEKSLQHYEPLLRDLKAKAAEGYARLLALAAPPVNGRRVVMAKQDLLELLKSYPKLRYQSLVLQQVITTFIGLRGHLSDELREVNFCRLRLTELQRLLEPEEAALIVGPSAADVQVYAEGSKNLADAVKAVLATVDAEGLRELDHRVQVVLTRDFTALVHVCLAKGSTVIKNLETAMRQTAEEFAAACLPQTDVAEIFLAKHAERNDALDELGEAYDQALPASDTGPKPNSELALLAAPPGPAGDCVRDWAHQTLNGAEMVTGTHEAMLIYREMSFLRITELEQFGPAARDAYLQMKSTEHFTPHTRTDVTFRT